MAKMILLFLLNMLSVEDFIRAQRFLDFLEAYKGTAQYLCMPANQMMNRLYTQESKYDENGDLLVVLFPNNGPRTICD